MTILIVLNEIYHQMTLATNTDLPTGYHLSGGIDSNTLVSLTKSIRTDQNFFLLPVSLMMKVIMSLAL